MSKFWRDALAGLRLLAAAIVVLLGGALVIALAPLRRDRVYPAMWALRRTLAVLLALFRVTVRCNAPERLRTHRGVVICNHQSIIDAWVLLSVAPLRFLAYDHMLRLPLIGQIARAIDTIQLSRDDAHSRVAARRQMAKQLRANAWPALVIFPEGTTNSGDERLLPFHRGAFDLAAGEGLPLLPCTLRFVPFAPFEWWRAESTMWDALWQLARHPGRKQATLTVHAPVILALKADTRAVADEIHLQMTAALSAQPPRIQEKQDAI